MEEIWRAVVEYEDTYEVSNKNGFRNKKTGKYLKGGISHNYVYHTLVGKHQFMQRIVARAFPEICGEWFEGCHVHHKNGNTLDNRPENLIVISPSEHSKMHYKHQSDLFKKASEKRSESIRKALTGRRAVEKHKQIVQLNLNGEVVKQWDCISDVQKELGYSAGNICMACKGKIKTAYGHKWQYAA